MYAIKERTMSKHTAANIRAMLGHPVIDGDGHWMEPIPVFLDYLAEVAGVQAVDTLRAHWQRKDAWYRATDDERLRQRIRRIIWWGGTSQTYDKASALLPALLHQRLPELGIDFALIYPTFGLTINAIPGDDLHAAASRAYNRQTADAFKPYADRFAPVAIIPARTPQQAIGELDYAVNELGYKAILLRGNQERTPAGGGGGEIGRGAWYCDTLGLDNVYDYDPFWQRCVALKVAVTQHSGSPSWPDRASVSNFTFNHVGHFAESNHAFARSVFLGGVAHRYPTLNFGFMEGGVSWASQLCCDLVEHWEKRTPDKLQDPRQTDLNELRTLIAQHGDARTKARVDALMDNLDPFRPGVALSDLTHAEHVVDDFAASGVQSKADIRAVFSKQFFFGCEADDRATMWAFDPRMGVRLRPVFSSDFTHFDVPDFAEVIPEAYEMVERRYVTEQDFREFTFTNAALLHTRNNADFFKGTVVEQAVADEMEK
jgi:predicted TIM-barrel fold metal-dependent hydrolase